jgi:hypothetical protein
MSVEPVVANAVVGWIAHEHVLAGPLVDDAGADTGGAARVLSGAREAAGPRTAYLIDARLLRNVAAAAGVGARAAGARRACRVPLATLATGSALAAGRTVTNLPTAAVASTDAAAGGASGRAVLTRPIG